jgi:Arm DNA-binding domain
MPKKMLYTKTGNTRAVRTDVGKNPATDKRKQVYKGKFRTKKAAELAQAEFITKIKNQGYFTPKNELNETRHKS